MNKHDADRAEGDHKVILDRIYEIALEPSMLEDFSTFGSMPIWQHNLQPVNKILPGLLIRFSRPTWGAQKRF